MATSDKIFLALIILVMIEILAANKIIPEWIGWCAYLLSFILFVLFFTVKN